MKNTAKQRNIIYDDSALENLQSHCKIHWGRVSGYYFKYSGHRSSIGTVRWWKYGYYYSNLVYAMV